MFKNIVLDSLFSYKGCISSRYYRAMLLVVLSCFALSVFPVLHENIIRPNNSYISFLEKNPLHYFYQFILLYCPIVLSIKRARAQSYSPAVGWIGGVFIYLLFWSLKHLLYLAFYSPSSQGLYIACGIFSVLGLLSIFVLSLHCPYDEQNEVYDGYYGFSVVTYVFKVFNTVIIFSVARTFLGIVNLSRSLGYYALVAVALAYVSYLLWCMCRRAVDAAISRWWVTGFVAAFIALEVIYNYSYSNLVMFFIECVLFGRLILIALPTRERGF